MNSLWLISGWLFRWGVSVWCIRCLVVVRVLGVFQLVLVMDNSLEFWNSLGCSCVIGFRLVFGKSWYNVCGLIGCLSMLILRVKLQFSCFSRCYLNVCSSGLMGCFVVSSGRVVVQWVKIFGCGFFVGNRWINSLLRQRLLNSVWLLSRLGILVFFRWVMVFSLLCLCYFVFSGMNGCVRVLVLLWVLCRIVCR